MADKLTFEGPMHSDQFDCDIFAAGDGKNKIFFSDKYKDFTSTYWYANPKVDKKEHFEKIMEFYKELRDSGFKPFHGKTFQPGVYFRIPYNPNPIDSLDGILEDPRLITENHMFAKFTILRIATLYGDFTMEKLEDGPWDTTNGRIAVVSNQDISKPLSKLVSELNRYEVAPESLEPLLRRVYTFE